MCLSKANWESARPEFPFLCFKTHKLFLLFFFFDHLLTAKASMHRHRAGASHQSNKPFKSRHASKGSLKEQSKGKINRTPVKQAGGKLVKKNDRRAAARQEQQKKREDLTRANRVFEGKYGAPKIVPVLSLCPDTDPHVTIAALFQSLGLERPQTNPYEPVLLDVARFKQKLLLVPVRRNFWDVLDIFKVADMSILLLSANVEVDKFGTDCLIAVQNQGIVSVAPVVQHMADVPAKQHTDVKKSLTVFLQQFFPEQTALYGTDTDTDSINVIRFITSHRPKPLAWRDLHPYMLAENVEYAPTSDV